MDLRGMLNDNGPAAAAGSSGKPLQPQQIQIQTQQPQPQPLAPLPSTPVQTVPQQPFRDYSQTQQSPIRQYSQQDYGGQNVPPGAFASSPYQSGGPGQYPNRPPQPPPLQQIAPNDLRSPSIGSGPVPSPYRPTPTSSISTASGGYPFPPPQQTPTSPVQRHQYPPTSAFHRESYTQPSGAVGMTGPPGASSYMQGPPLPQTPPIGPPAGGAHPYPHQRSQSSQSTPTPTSAQSQSGAQYGASFIHGSPVATTHQLPQMEHQQRQSSQPPTPIAGPLSAGPRAGQTLNFPQPPSPYQHRLQSTPAYHPPPSHSSPPPPPPPSLPRHPSSQSIYESHPQDIARRAQSHSERERSVSISPKTRVPSLPSSAGRPGTSVSDSEARHLQNLPPSASGPAMEIERERDQLFTPAKRKLEDRELRSDELERRETRPPPFQDVADRSVRPESATQKTASTKRPRRKMIHKTAPIWAQSMQGRKLTNPNCIIYRPKAHHAPQVNGKSESLVSRHTSPEERRSTIVPQAAPPPQPAAQPPTRQAVEQSVGESLLGHFESSITAEPPRSSLLNKLCDFFFATVVRNDQLGEIQSRGVKFEIEAKFGILIDRGTNNRINLPVETDCILSDHGGWFAFRSSMTEAQHKGFNDFLNEMVMAAHPDNKANIGRPPRLPLKYQHRREIDKFFDLPENTALPGCVTSLLAASGHRPKVRVTYDQKTNDVLAKIIKARVHDIHLFLPESTLDCRISVNLEMDWEGPVEALENQTKRAPAPDRMKDRLSYSHGLYQVDLTQVTQVNAQRPEKQHELEIEVNPAAIIDQGQRAAAGQSNMYIELVGGFLNNICVLARKA